MIRTITGFHADAEGEWVAELSCYHNQHIRHRPPFQPRPWVLDPTGRESRLGSQIECPLCDRPEMPGDLILDRRLGPWTEQDVPEALRSAHLTPGRRWGRLCITGGAIDFQFRPGDDPPGERLHLASPAEQLIPPDVPHRVIPIGPAEVHLELWSRPRAEAAPNA